MDLSKLFQLQRQLDERIEREHPRQEGEDRLAKKILALQVELGELCNCWRGFKFWSNDQEPRTLVENTCDVCQGYCFIDNVNYPISDDQPEIKCPNCNGNGVIVKNPLLEEYVDCLHFILSIGLELNIAPKLITGIYECPNVLEQFNSVFEGVAHFWSSVNEDWGYEAQVEFYIEIFRGFKALGRMLGFTQKQVEEAYISKNAVNHQRQERGY
jgi:dimeric dUTPase (all-alpha-NTP-PPase superfamily)